MSAQVWLVALATALVAVNLRAKKSARARKPSPSSLTNRVRYARQATVLGVAGDALLATKRVLVVGCGGLGSAVVPLLAGAGVGCLGLCDDDVVEESNLHRQTIHSELTLGMEKVESARRFVHRLNAQVVVETFAVRVDSENAASIVSLFDLVLDCTDNVHCRYALNDACVACGKTLISGAALGTSGQLAVFSPELHGCLRCAFPAPMDPEHRGTCAEDGVLGPVPAVIGGLQALEAIKLLSGGKAGGHIVSLDLSGVLDGYSWGVVKQKRNAGCPVCSALAEPRPLPSLDSVALFKGDLLCAAGRAVVIVDLGGAEAHLAPCRENLMEIVSVSMEEIRKAPREVWRRISDAIKQNRKEQPVRDVVFVCRRGQTSLAAVSLMEKSIPKQERSVEFKSYSV